MESTQQADNWSPKLLSFHIFANMYKTTNYIQENNLQSCIYNNTIHIGEDMESTQVPVNRGMDKEIVVHLFDGILLSHRGMKFYHLPKSSLR